MKPWLRNSSNFLKNQLKQCDNFSHQFGEDLKEALTANEGKRAPSQSIAEMSTDSFLQRQCGNILLEWGAAGRRQRGRERRKRAGEGTET